MDGMENFCERFEALEQQTEQLRQQIHILARQARWWRGIACGVIVLALLGLPLQSGNAQYEGKDLAQRVAALEYKLEYVSGGANEMVITGANLRIVNGLGSTDTINGLGNLIVGYNEERGVGDDRRTGSHNVVVGSEHNFSRFGGVVVGLHNETSGDYSSVSGGSSNTASGIGASVSGGQLNTASGFRASVSGGSSNTASGAFASVSGGQSNTASSTGASVSGGQSNTASGFRASVSGGASNTASGAFASVSGGQSNTASGGGASVSGGLSNTASGTFASVSGGSLNTASGGGASVSGGRSRRALSTFNWAAGPLFAEDGCDRSIPKSCVA